MPPDDTWRMEASFSRMETIMTPVTRPKHAKFHAPMGPWMKS